MKDTHELRKSNRKGKKFMIEMAPGMFHRVGDSDYQDHNTHGDEQRTQNYIKHHGPKSATKDMGNEFIVE